MKYVISSSEFKSKAEALEKICRWAEDNDLKEGTCVYQVVKKFVPMSTFKLYEEKL